jgi:hypothetical protein
MRLRNKQPIWAAALLLAAWLAPVSAPAVTHTAIAVADFDYRDTSGEAKDQAAQHAARLQIFDRVLRDKLAAQGRYRLVPLDCAKPRCSTTTLGAEGLIDSARKAGARLLVYGGIHKESTLVQWAEVQVVDLSRKKVVFGRTFSFRGDTDEAFRRAAGFIGESLADIAAP